MSNLRHNDKFISDVFSKAVGRSMGRKRYSMSVAGDERKVVCPVGRQYVSGQDTKHVFRCPACMQ